MFKVTHMVMRYASGRFALIAVTVANFVLCRCTLAKLVLLVNNFAIIFFACSAGHRGAPAG